MIHPRLLLRPVALSFVLLAACGPGASSPSGEPEPITLIARGLELGPNEPILVGLDATRIEVIATAEPASARIAVCRVATPKAPLPPLTSCVRDLARGVRTPIAGEGLLAFVLQAPGYAVLELRIDALDEQRSVELILPAVAGVPATSACQDNACNPFIELLPVEDGVFHATATFAGGEGVFVLEQGRILARSQTGTGVPYRSVARDEGPSPLEIASTLTAQAEYALAIRPGSRMTDVRIAANWP